MKYLVIANPEAGAKTLAPTLEHVRSAFEAREIICEVRFTQFLGHAARIAAEGLREGFTHMISLGGDGTSSEIAGSGWTGPWRTILRNWASGVSVPFANQVSIPEKRLLIKLAEGVCA